MPKSMLFLPIIGLLTVLTGCATLTRGTTETYNVTSIPSGASVAFSSGETCVTPCAFEKKRNESFALNIVKDGYKPYEIKVEPKTAGESAAKTTLANLVMVGSFLWVSLDAILGSNKNLTPNPGMAKLVPAEGSNIGVAKLVPLEENTPKVVGLLALEDSDDNKDG